MMLIGNDIVDLSGLFAEKKASNKRFVLRVCSQEEQKTVVSSEDPDRLLWTLWAIKEASFKALKKARPETVFIPPHFICQDMGGSFWRCFHQNAPVVCQVFQSNEFVYAVAALGDNFSVLAAILNDISTIEQEAEESAKVRLLAIHLLEKKGFFGCEIVRKEENGKLMAPEILMGGKVLSNCDVSLSHDGRFAAAAVFCNDFDAESFTKEM